MWRGHHRVPCSNPGRRIFFAPALHVGEREAVAPPCCCLLLSKFQCLRLRLRLFTTSWWTGGCGRKQHMPRPRRNAVAENQMQPNLTSRGYEILSCCSARKVEEY